MGATSHLAKSLIHDLAAESSKHKLRLFTRRPALARDFLTKNTIHQGCDDACLIIENYDHFPDEEYDAIINCVGIGTIRKHQGEYSKYFTVYEHFDNLAINYLHKHPKTRYISLGSGSVYGSHFENPAGEFSTHAIPVNKLSREDYYSVSRLYAEAKHRALENLAIIDFRIFSFFSRFHDPADGYLIDQIITAIQNKTPLLTSHDDFYRDYLHPADLHQAISNALVCKQAINGAYDLCSQQPLLKSEMLAFFEEQYGLSVSYTDALIEKSATGQKSCYFSTYRESGLINFHPNYSSRDALSEESAHLLAT